MSLFGFLKKNQPKPPAEPTHLPVKAYVLREHWVPGRVIHESVDGFYILGDVYPRVYSLRSDRVVSATDLLRSNSKKWSVVEDPHETLTKHFKAPYLGCLRKVRRLLPYIFPGYMLRLKESRSELSDMYVHPSTPFEEVKEVWAKNFSQSGFLAVQIIRAEKSEHPGNYNYKTGSHIAQDDWQPMNLLDNWTEEGSVVQAMPFDPELSNHEKGWWFYTRCGNEFVSGERCESFTLKELQDRSLTFKRKYYDSQFDKEESAWIAKMVKKAKKRSSTGCSS